MIFANPSAVVANAAPHDDSTLVRVSAEPPAFSLFQVIVVIRAPCVRSVSVFLDRTHNQLFDIVDCNVIASLDADLLAYVLGLLRLACDVDTVAARDGDHSPARDNQIGAAFMAPSIARLVLLILPIHYAESNRGRP